MTDGQSEVCLQHDLDQRMIQHIFIDMDGVLADMVGGALRVLHRQDVLDDWPPGEYSIPKVLGMDEHEFWGCIDHNQEKFWSALHPYPWAAELVEYCESLAPVTILSSPSECPYSAAGKLQWLKRWFPQFMGGEGKRRRYMLGTEKHLLSRPGRILIDDSDENVRLWCEANGDGILFPQPWNRLHAAVAEKDQETTGHRRMAIVCGALLWAENRGGRPSQPNLVSVTQVIAGA